MIVGSDDGNNWSLGSHLLRRGFDVSHAVYGEEAVRMLRVYDPALILLGSAESDASTLATLEQLKQAKPEVAALMLSGHHDPGTIFKASKLGVDDCLSQPFEPRELDLSIDRILEKQRPSTEVAQLRDQVRRNSHFAMLFGTSPKMEEVKTPSSRWPTLQPQY